MPCSNEARRISRHRNNISRSPASSASRDFLVVPESYQEYASEPEVYENSLVSDSGVGDRQRIIIFGRESTDLWIGLVEKLYVDGTFSLTLPPPILQGIIQPHPDHHIIAISENGINSPSLHLFDLNKCKPPRKS